VQHAELDGQQEHGPETPAGAVISANRKAHRPPTGHCQAPGSLACAARCSLAGPRARPDSAICRPVADGVLEAIGCRRPNASLPLARYIDIDDSQGVLRAIRATPQGKTIERDQAGPSTIGDSREPSG
jgi:hypothetical protein